MWPFKKKQEQRSLENPSVSLSDPRALALIFGETESATGITVTEAKALGVPAVWAAVNFLSSTIASLPLNLFKRTGKDRERDSENPLQHLLHDAPNSWWTSYRWRKFAMSRILLGGRSYTLIVRSVGGQITRLIPLTTTVKVIDRSPEAPLYEVHGVTQRYEASDVIDLQWLSEADGVTHIDPVGRLKNALGLAIALETYASRFFQNGGVPPAVLEGPMNSPAAIKRASDDLGLAVKEATQKKSPVIALPLGHTLKPLGIDPEKGQMSEARRFQLEEVARIFGLPPVFLQDLTHGTFANTEQQDLNVVKHVLTQWITCWEQELNLKLFGQDRQRFVQFNIDGMLRGDFSARMTGMAAAVQNALMTPNEARQLENRPPQEHGDKLLIQGATVPLGSQKVAAPAAPPKAAPDAG